MRILRRSALAVSLAVILAACGGAGTPGSGATGPDAGLKVVMASVTDRAEPQIEDAKDVGKVGEATAAFALDLYRRVAEEQKGNVVVGPYSTWLALAMTSVGAAGATSKELAKALRFPLDEERLLPAVNALDRTISHRAADAAVRFDVANRLWGQEGTRFLEPFLDALVQHFGAPLVAADFASDPEAVRASINGWVGDQTQGKIPELFPEGTIEKDTQLALVNAVHLDAPWEFSFDPAMTSTGEFTPLDGSKVSADLMHYDEYLPTAYTADWQAVELPYEGSGLSMVVIVPKDFAAFEAGFDAAALTKVLRKIKDGGVHLTMPRFSFSTHTSLVEPLKAMGVRSAFGGSADFSRMTEGGGLHVGVLEHEAFVKVDEHGTEAAAATGVGMLGSHGPGIDATKPFLFLIRDRATNATLFAGRVLDPTK